MGESIRNHPPKSSTQSSIPSVGTSERTSQNGSGGLEHWLAATGLRSVIVGHGCYNQWQESADCRAPAEGLGLHGEKPRFLAGTGSHHRHLLPAFRSEPVS